MNELFPVNILLEKLIHVAKMSTSATIVSYATWWQKFVCVAKLSNGSNRKPFSDFLMGVAIAGTKSQSTIWTLLHNQTNQTNC